MIVCVICEDPGYGVIILVAAIFQSTQRQPGLLSQVFISVSLHKANDAENCVH